MKKLIYVCTLLMAAMACENKQQETQKSANADSLINIAIMAQERDKIMALADSFEKTGDISPIRAAQYRGEAYTQLYNFTEAENEFKKAIDSKKPTNLKDSIAQFCCVSNLVQLYGLRRNHDEVLLTAIPAMDELKGNNLTSDDAVEVEGHRMVLDLYLGNSQLALGKRNEAARTYDQCYKTALRLLEFSEMILEDRVEPWKHGPISEAKVIHQRKMYRHLLGLDKYAD